MFLKRISICGFKSFADRVDFDFGPGVTCIVGPNGCGKSNVVDAFKWVLGEQSARSLRGRQMSDMIFNGSSARKSSSLAQVDLLFDNADRSLDMDTEEVMITRKLYRSGESEYFLNKEAARLKDIRELFMDTGVGVESYSVVEQGRVDGLLQSNPVERRIIFEEAAGISKYKARRREAQRKLERTQQNLLRVDDVVAELEKRLRSVKLQAGKARSYKELEGRLNELRSSFAMAEYHRFSKAVESLSLEAAERKGLVGDLKLAIGKHEADESRLAAELEQLAEQINLADGDFIQTKSQRVAQEQQIDTATQRVEEHKVLLGQAEERRAAAAEQLTSAHDDLAKLEESSELLAQESTELTTALSELVGLDQQLARELTQQQSVLEDEKAGVIELLRRSAQVNNEIIRLDTHRESLVDQKGRLSQRDAQLTTELESSLSDKAELERKVLELDGLIAEEQRRLDEKKADAARADELCTKLVEELANAKQHRSAQRSRHELLEDLEQRKEGVGEASRKLLDRKHSEDCPESIRQIVGLVADLLDADVDHSEIIEAALDETTRSLVITSSEILLQDQTTLSELAGRVEIIALDRIPPIINQGDFTETPGYVGRACDLVRVAPPYEQLLGHLLGKTVVMEDLRSALAAAKEDVSGHRFVTRHGEVIESDGRLRLGPPSRGAVGLISRRSELRSLSTQLIELDTNVAKLDDQLNRAQAEVSHLSGVQQELRTAIYESSTAKVKANAALTNIAESVDRLTREQPQISQQVTMIEHQIAEVHAKASEEGRSLAAVEQENQKTESRIDSHQDRIDATVASRNEIQEKLTHARVRAGQMSEKRSAAAEAMSALRRRIADWEASQSTSTEDIQRCEDRIREALEGARHGRETLVALDGRIEELEQRCTALRREREEHRQESEQLSTAIKEARNGLEVAETKLQESKMSLAETNVRRDDLITRVKDELDIDLAERHAQYEHEDQDWEEVEQEITECRRKMDRLGNVNLDAINELEELEERHDFLVTQRDDLTNSHRQLEQLIVRLNDESKERFRKTFIEIRDHFRALFRKLFGGGRADIILEDEENILECGIEILAQPPGKELRAITLMSGGEKSLTAIALLMSIFQSRPAPFAILDEVDAALDEANNDRFNRIIQEFVTHSQFLVITHSKSTMSIGDRLYGVTMQEPGVSTRVSVDLTNANVA